MAPTSHLLLHQVNTAPNGGIMEYPIYASSILFATSSLAMVLLIIPPLCWHLRNHNLGATMLVAWVIMLNLQSVINALVWSNDDIGHWYNGSGLCDVEVKLQVASDVALPAALACVLRALAEVMDTDRATLVKTKAQRWRRYAVDLLWCIGFPLLQMLFHYIVQVKRYYIIGIAGCLPTVSTTWVTILLIHTPPLIWILVDVYFAILILVRLYHYHLAFASILSHSNTTRSRFMRLYILCLLSILGWLPVESYILYRNLLKAHGDFTWSSAHDAATWNDIEMIPSGGHIIYTPFIWLIEAIVVFVFFGVGKEALGMYRSGLVTLGFGRIFKSLNRDHVRRDSSTGTLSSFSSKAKLFFKRKSSVSTYTDSNTSHAASAADPQSPKKVTFLDTIDESERGRKQQSQNIALQSGSVHRDFQKPTTSGIRRAIWKRLVSACSNRKSRVNAVDDELALTSLDGHHPTTRSDVTFGERSSSLPGYSQISIPCEVVVRKEVRLGVEMSDSLPPTAYHAV